MNTDRRHTGRTVSEGLDTSYYGIQVVKAPHWRWKIIFYFFFGGMAGAGFTIGTLANLFTKEHAVERAARYVAWAALVPCPPLLILDLGRPERFLHMLRVVKLRSAMSLGSWALSGLGAVATLLAGVEMLEVFTGKRSLERWRRPIGILALPFSIFLSGYTGVLLAATNIPIWWRAFPFLSPTFVSSAFSTSLTAISAVLHLSGAETEDTARKIARAETIALSAELTGLSLVLLRLGTIGRPLRTGRLGLVFWPVTVVGGLIVPLYLQATGPARGRPMSPARRWTATALTLIGGLSLRALVVLAGHESARNPEDYFWMTRNPRSDA